MAHNAQEVIKRIYKKMTKREMININDFLNLVAEDLQLGKVLENPIQVAGGFMHRVFKIVTEKGSYIRQNCSLLRKN